MKKFLASILMVSIFIETCLGQEYPQTLAPKSVFSDGYLGSAEIRYSVEDDKVVIRQGGRILGECAIITLGFDIDTVISSSQAYILDYGDFEGYLRKVQVRVFRGTGRTRSYAAFGFIDAGIVYIDGLLLKDNYRLGFLHLLICSWLIDRYGRDGDKRDINRMSAYLFPKDFLRQDFTKQQFQEFLRLCFRLLQNEKIKDHPMVIYDCLRLAEKFCKDPRYASLCVERLEDIIKKGKINETNIERVLSKLERISDEKGAEVIARDLERIGRIIDNEKITADSLAEITSPLYCIVRIVNFGSEYLDMAEFLLGCNLQVKPEDLAKALSYLADFTGILHKKGLPAADFMWVLERIRGFFNRPQVKQLLRQDEALYVLEYLLTVAGTVCGLDGDMQERKDCFASGVSLLRRSLQRKIPVHHLTGFAVELVSVLDKKTIPAVKEVFRFLLIIVIAQFNFDATTRENIKILFHGLRLIFRIFKYSNVPTMELKNRRFIRGLKRSGISKNRIGPLMEKIVRHMCILRGGLDSTKEVVDFLDAVTGYGLKAVMKEGDFIKFVDELGTMVNTIMLNYAGHGSSRNLYGPIVDRILDDPLLKAEEKLNILKAINTLLEDLKEYGNVALINVIKEYIVSAGDGQIMDVVKEMQDIVDEKIQKNGKSRMQDTSAYLYHCQGFSDLLERLINFWKVIVQDSFGVASLRIPRWDLAGDPLLQCRINPKDKDADLRNRVRALLLTHMREIIVYSAEKVRDYSAAPGSVLVKYLRTHAGYSFGFGSYPHIIKGYTIGELARELGSTEYAKGDIISIVEDMGFFVEEKGTTFKGAGDLLYISTSLGEEMQDVIFAPIDVITSVFRGTREIDSTRSQFVTHSLEHALYVYGKRGGEMSDKGDEGISAKGNKSLQELDYALMCYEGINSRTRDIYVPVAFYYGEEGKGSDDSILRYSYKRTVTIEGKTGLEIFEDIVDKQKKERIAEEVIFRILSRISKGAIEQESAGDYLTLLSEMIEILRELYNWEHWVSMFGYVDKEFNMEISRVYVSGQDNSNKLIESLNNARKRSLGYLRETLSSEDRRYRLLLEHLEKQNALWREENKNLLDYLRFKKDIRDGTYTADSKRQDILREADRIMNMQAEMRGTDERAKTYREYSFEAYVRWMQKKLSEDRGLQEVIGHIQAKPRDDELRMYRPMREWFLKMPTRIHGIAHESRVLLLAETIMNMRGGISDRDRESIRLSAVTHDTRRQDDGKDVEHGVKSGKWVRDNLKRYFPDADISQVANINSGHVPPDKGILPPNLKIFKDADGLDRWRIGDLDINYLRYAESKKLAELARYLYTISSDLTRLPNYLSQSRRELKKYCPQNSYFSTNTGLSSINSSDLLSIFGRLKIPHASSIFSVS